MANHGNANLTQMLHEAALENNVTVLRDLLSQDPLLLDRSLPASPLHVACKHGCLAFVVELLNRNQSLSEELDSNRSSPLHVASQNGHSQLIQPLVVASRAMCFSRDMLGMTPAHVAATKGWTPVLEELLRLAPIAAKERVGTGVGGDTILHLCVKYGQLEALRTVLEKVGDKEMLNAKNGDGNSILHLAVGNKQPEIVKELLKHKRLDKHILNTNGWTARDIFEQNQSGRKREMKDTHENERDLDEKLRRTLEDEKVFQSIDITEDLETDLYMNWFEGKRNSLMVAASLIATIAFQAGINPPSGVSQDTDPRTAVTAVKPKLSQHNYFNFLIVNTFCLVCAMSCLLLLIFPVPPKRTMRRLLLFVTSSMVASMGFLVYAYSIALYAITYGVKDSLMGPILLYVLPLAATCVFVGIVFASTSLNKRGYLVYKMISCLRSPKKLVLFFNSW